MGSKGDCFDNALAESLFTALKNELIHGRSWPSKAELPIEHDRDSLQNPSCPPKRGNSRDLARRQWALHHSAGVCGVSSVAQELPRLSGRRPNAVRT